MVVLSFGTVIYNIEVNSNVTKAVSSVNPAKLAFSVRVTSRLRAVPSLLYDLAEFAAAAAAVSSMKS